MTGSATLLDLTDPIALSRDLIARRSVTPADDGALDVLQAAAESLGFVCTRHPFGDVDNLFAKRSTGAPGPHLAFAGHTDVVPPGPEAAWTSPPFAPTERNGALFGRGAADMKTAIAAFLAAIARAAPQRGTVSLLITGDEEGEAINGTKKLMEAVHQAGERFDQIIVGEPTSQTSVGDVIKNGRRGSCNAVITVNGRQGHVAYPDQAANPIPVLLAILSQLTDRDLDQGPVAHFQPSNLEVTSIDVGNLAHNVIPAHATARLNIRFNVAHKGADLATWIAQTAQHVAATMPFDGVVETDIAVPGEAFLTPEGPFTQMLQNVVEAETGQRPHLATGGGSSDARFLKDYAPVAELGLVGATMHKVDEHVLVQDIETLTRIYARLLNVCFDPEPSTTP